MLVDCGGGGGRGQILPFLAELGLECSVGRTETPTSTGIWGGSWGRACAVKVPGRGRGGLHSTSRASGMTDDGQT